MGIDLLIHKYMYVTNGILTVYMCLMKMSTYDSKCIWAQIIPNVMV